MARAQDWDLIFGSRLVLLLEQLLLAPRGKSGNVTVGHNLTWEGLITPVWEWTGRLHFIPLLWGGAVLHCCAWFIFLNIHLLKIYRERDFFQSMSGGFVVDCWLCLWKSHFSDLTALHSATSARAPLILSWPRWFKMNVLSKQSEAKLPLRWVRGENLGKGNEHPKHKEIIVFSFSTIRFPGWWAL